MCFRHRKWEKKSSVTKFRHRFLARGFDWEVNIGYQLTSIINLFSVSESCVFAAKTTSVGNKRIPSLLICVYRAGGERGEILTVVIIKLCMTHWKWLILWER